MRKWSAAMKRLRPKEHAANVTERDEVGPMFVRFRTHKKNVCFATYTESQEGTGLR